MSNINGVKEFNAALSKLLPKIAEKIAKKALRKAANLVASQSRQNVPVKTGRLKKAIRVKNSRYNRLRRNGIVGVILRVSPGRNRADTKNAFYAHWVEYGFNRGSRQVSAAEAVSLGVVTRGQFESRRKALNRRRRPGQNRQRIRYRAGGNRVEGQYFVRNAFESLKGQAAQRIIDGGTQAAIESARETNLI